MHNRKRLARVDRGADGVLVLRRVVGEIERAGVNVAKRVVPLHHADLGFNGVCEAVPRHIERVGRRKPRVDLRRFHFLKRAAGDALGHKRDAIVHVLRFTKRGGHWRNVVALCISRREDQRFDCFSSAAHGGIISKVSSQRLPYHSSSLQAPLAKRISINARSGHPALYGLKKLFQMIMPGPTPQYTV